VYFLLVGCTGCHHPDLVARSWQSLFELLHLQVNKPPFPQDLKLGSATDLPYLKKYAI
jgi:hypothetical protein